MDTSAPLNNAKTACRAPNLSPKHHNARQMLVAGLADAVGGLRKDGTEGHPLGDGGGTRDRATSPAAALEGKFNRVNSGIVVSDGPPVQPSRPPYGLGPGFKMDLKSIGAELLASRLSVSGRPDERFLSSEFLIIGF